MADTNEVNRLLLELQDNLDKARLSLTQLEERLERIKILGRSPETARPIFTKRAISIVASYGLQHDACDVSREALRILANAFLLNEASRQIFVDLGYPTKLAVRLASESRHDEFLVSRILFLLTYKTTVDFELLATEARLAENIIKRLVSHAREISDAKVKPSTTHSSIENMALVETLKLQFNITHHYPLLQSIFSPSIEPIGQILLCQPLAKPPLQSPIDCAINALLNLDLTIFENESTKCQEGQPESGVLSYDCEQLLNKLVVILEKAIKSYTEHELDRAAAPLCTLLRRLYEIVNPGIKAHMRSLLLPGKQDREMPLGKSDTLASLLLRLSCSPNLPTLHENISSLLFELSDKNASIFIQNIGYGYASGFLASHNIQVPPNAMRTQASSSNTGLDTGQLLFNPVTGQRLEAEQRDSPAQSEMTDEEKEREAERLFVLFERLKATGVVKVKNPVEQAVEEGRFEEVD